MKNKKVRAVYQWILRNNQELGFPRFTLTETYHYADKMGRAEIRDLYSVESLFSPVSVYRPSKVNVDFIVAILREEVRVLAVRGRLSKEGD